MHKLNKNISKIILMVLLAVAAVVGLLFYSVGDIDPAAQMPEPVFTDFLLDYMYVLLIISVLIAIASAMIMFATKWAANPKSALITFAGVGFLALLMLLTYVLGDKTELKIVGFDGQQTSFDLKLTDMCLYSSYILLGMALIVSCLSFLSKRIF